MSSHNEYLYHSDHPEKDSLSRQVRYQLYDREARDLIVIGEEEYTRRETAEREEARQAYLLCEDKSDFPPNTAYLVKTHIGSLPETEGEYKDAEQENRRRYLIPAGQVPRLSFKQRELWHQRLEKIRGPYKGLLDKLTDESFSQIETPGFLYYEKGANIKVKVLEGLPCGK